MRVLVALTATLGAIACSTHHGDVAHEPAPAARSTAATLGVPPGHLPPPGLCRIWMAGRPPGHQPSPQSCDGIVTRAPAGSMILYRPPRDRRTVRVQYVDDRRAGVVVRIRLFEAKTGKLLRDQAG